MVRFVIDLDSSGNINYVPATSFYIEEGGSYYTENNCDCEGESKIPLVVQCRSCNKYINNVGDNLPESYNVANQKRIWKASRVDQSQYIDSISSLNVYTPPTLFTGVNWNQMSDRAIPSVVKRNVPSRGSSTKSSITRERPGAQSAPGIGVDVKHGSYHRYLERLKGKGPSRTQPPNNNFPLYGNKTRSYGISNTSNCFCT